MLTNCYFGVNPVVDFGIVPEARGGANKKTAQKRAVGAGVAGYKLAQTGAQRARMPEFILAQKAKSTLYPATLPLAV